MSEKYILTRMYNRDICAIFSDDKCCALNIYPDDDITGNIYVGRVENIVSNINSAFIEIKKGVKCYYSLNDNKKLTFINPKKNNTLNINDHILVQVLRGPIKTKPATVTGTITLTGEYVVLKNDMSGVSISSKIKDREELSQILKQLKEYFEGYPFGFILRTNVSNLIHEKNDACELILSEAKALSEKYENLLKRASYSNCFTTVYTAEPAYIKDLKCINISGDYEIVTDSPDKYKEINEAFDNQLNTRLYQDDLFPIYKLYSLEHVFERALARKVWLKCGGYLYIEQTEALNVIDVNSGKCVSKKKDKGLIEQTKLKVNLEAAREITYQIRLRNLSGIIIIDFINMNSSENNKELLRKFSQYLKEDTIKAKVEDITKLGLIEVTRQKSGKTLYENIKTEYENSTGKSLLRNGEN